MAANQLRVGADDPARLERGLKELSEAYREPEALEPARERFVDNAMGPIRAAIDACTRAAAEPFISQNYLNGQARDEVQDYEDMFRQQFAETLKKMTARTAEVAARAKGSQ